MTSPLSIIAPALAALALLLAVLRMPPRPGGPGAEGLDRSIQKLEDAMFKLQDERRELRVHIEALGDEISLREKLASDLAPQPAPTAVDTSRLRPYTDQLMRDLVHRITESRRLYLNNQDEPKLLDQVTDAVTGKLALNDTQRRIFDQRLRKLYAGYDLAVRRWGKDTARVQTEVKPQRKQALQALQKLFTPHQWAQWQGGYAGWHPYLKVLFKP